MRKTESKQLHKGKESWPLDYGDLSGKVTSPSGKEVPKSTPVPKMQIKSVSIYELPRNTTKEFRVGVFLGNSKITID